MKSRAAGVLPPDLVDEALDQAFVLLGSMTGSSSDGLEKLVLTPGELQRQRDTLRRDLAKQLAAAVETPLGDELEERLGALVIDAVIDQALESADFLVAPAERLARLESAVADVKAELGLLRLSTVRVQQTLASRAARPALLLVAAAIAAAVAGFFYSPARVHSLARLALAHTLSVVHGAAAFVAARTAVA